jgi:hypothetical protein
MRSAEHAPSPENDSNRGQGESQIYSNKSWGYVGSDGKRWDTSDIFMIKKDGIIVFLRLDFLSVPSQCFHFQSGERFENKHIAVDFFYLPAFVDSGTAQP